MTGNQPDPPRTGRGEMACRCMPAGCENDVRPAMLRITAIAACRPRRVAIDHFSSPYQSDGCSSNRTKPVLRRSGDDAPCSPERGCRAALRRCIPADCVLTGTDRVRCRTGRTVHRHLSHAHFRKERASFARARPDKGLTGQRGGRNGCGRREVTKLKHAARGMHRPRGGPALPDKAEQCRAAFLPIGSRPFTPICRANWPGCRGEMFHALYMPPAAREPRVVRASIDRCRVGRPHGYTAKPARVMSASAPVAGACGTP
ncbi:MAG: hypothetical protein GAK33_02439 [Burkholderia lata]|uniref:Uncharacterized protein n=1 Tax=Burkholderia lata (strain ATCC 17760 / DSM 23089 / LMG 22485 / NCIMB 9086 / R18194 / 383) TaxID=482957 RepID=A0A833V206_BURL3|nr:MAG: hypothetical protein GAK33_02439 [Burkholderia lata]